MKLLLVLSLLTIGPVTAFAQENSGGLFIEPAITYESGSGDINLPSPFSNSENDLDGFGLGARLGFHVYESIFIGVDGRYSFVTFKENKINMDTDAKAWNIGPVVGVQMPTDLGIRVWGSYILAGEVDPDKDKEVDLKFKSGNGFRLGVGIKLLMVSVNAEYQKIKYDETKVQSLAIFDPGSTTNNVSLDNESVVLSVSFPVSI